MVEGLCKRCNKFRKLAGSWCEECASEAEARRNPLNEEREKFSKDEMQKIMSERRYDKKFWKP